jgi:hypothetical protein
MSGSNPPKVDHGLDDVHDRNSSDQFNSPSFDFVSIFIQSDRERLVANQIAFVQLGGVSMTNTGTSMSSNQNQNWRDCISDAIQLITQHLIRGDLRFLRSCLEGQSRHHIAFLYDNYLFFVRVESDEAISIPNIDHQDFLVISEAAIAHAVVLRLAWNSAKSSWVLANPNEFMSCAYTGAPVEPDDLVSIDPRELPPIVMTPYELQDLAITVVCDDLRKSGISIVSAQASRRNYPSIEFEGGKGIEYVFVRASRYPNLDPVFPTVLLDDIRQRGLSIGATYFARVCCASQHEVFDRDAMFPSVELVRGEGVIPRYAGLEPISAIAQHLSSEREKTLDRIDPDRSSLISWVSATSSDWSAYEGDMDWNDLHPKAQDRILLSLLDSDCDPVDVQELGLVRQQYDALELILGSAIFFLRENGYIQHNHYDNNSAHQIERFFEGTQIGLRIKEMLSGKPMPPQKRRTSISLPTIAVHPNTLIQKQVDFAEYDRTAVLELASMLGLGKVTENPFPLGENCSLFKDLIIRKGIFTSDVTWIQTIILRVLQDRALPRNAVVHGFNSEAEFRSALKKVSKAEESVLMAVTKIIVRSVASQISDDLSEEKTLSIRGYQLLDLGFDCLAHLERASPSDWLYAKMSRLQLLSRAFKYEFDPLNDVSKSHPNKLGFRSSEMIA